MAGDMIRCMNSFFLPAAAKVGEAIWQPATDVYRTRAGWLIKFDLAGVRPEDMRVVVRGCRLRVEGVRRDLCLEEGCRHYLMEITYSPFERELTLPDDIEHYHLALEHRHGMLLVRIQGETESR
jgi:HSP20 family protein